MTIRQEERTIPTQVTVVVCDRCKIEVTAEEPGWICCHEMQPNNRGAQLLASLMPQLGAAATPDQHLCPKCKHLLSDFVTQSPLPPPSEAAMRGALERIIADASQSAALGSEGAKRAVEIARAGLEGKEQPRPQVSVQLLPLTTLPRAATKKRVTRRTGKAARR